MYDKLVWNARLFLLKVFFLFFYTVKVKFVLKVVVNCKSLKPDRLDGIGVYTLQLLSKLVEKRKDWTFIFVYDKLPANPFPFPKNVKNVSWICPTYRPPFLHAYLHFLNYVCNKEKADVLFSPDGWAPTNLKIPLVVTIHDLNFVRNPEYLPWYWSSTYGKQFPKIASKADQILTVSEFSKKEIMELYDIPASKISVTYNGVHGDFKPGTEEEIFKIREKYKVLSPYFLYVGTLHERKNIKGLFAAYALYRKAGGVWPLVIVGNPLFGDAANSFMGPNYPYLDSVVFTGRVNLAELKNLYKAAGALFFIPFYEGFGIPVIEAMASGIPVLTSSVSSLPEVVGNAALLTPPNDLTNIAQLLKELEENASLREELKKRGLARAAEFSWDKEMEVLHQILSKYERA